MSACETHIWIWTSLCSCDTVRTPDAERKPTHSSMPWIADTCSVLSCTVQYVGWFLPPPLASLQSLLRSPGLLRPLFRVCLSSTAMQGDQLHNASVWATLLWTSSGSELALPHNSWSLGPRSTTAFQTDKCEHFCHYTISNTKCDAMIEWKESTSLS